MKVQNVTSGFAFARNPIILRETFPGDAFDRRGGKLTIIMSGTNIYEGRFFPPLNIDISEIIDAFIWNFPEPPEDNTDPIVEIYDWGTLADFSIQAIAEYDGYEGECDFWAIPGGISKQNFRRFVNLGTDVFDSRFLNPKGNFFFTTRTAGWRVIMKETELYPLYFLIKNEQQQQIDIIETVTGKTMSIVFGNGVAALDVDALRRRFMEQYKVIPNIFDIYMGGVFSCRIVVEKSDITKERYRLKFRNSLGVFEIIELTGELSISPEYEDTDETTFKRLDSVTGDFYTERERIERSLAVTVETGVKRPDEVRFLMDMIASEEVYLLDLTALPVKVIPSVEEFTYRQRPEAPEKFTIKLAIADTETNIMQDIIDGSEGRKPRVFSKQFSKQFN